MTFFKRSFTLISISAALLACNKVDFAEQPSAPGGSPGPTSPPTTTHIAPGVRSDQFTSGGSSQTGALDIVWVIDNSGSMSVEIAHVRANLTNFVSQIATKADVKLAVISLSEAQSPYGLTVALRPQDIQITSNVQSTFPLAVATLGLCAPTAIALSNAACQKIGSVYGRSSTSRRYAVPLATFNSDDTVNNVTPADPNQSFFTGLLHGFLRTASAKTFVFVTDDNSNPLNATGSDFLNAFRATFPGQTPKVFGFVGKGIESPCQAAEGSAYIDLAAATGGQTYNICAADWANSFGQLTQSVLAQIQTRFTLSASVVTRIREVRLNGRILTSAQYSLVGNILGISASLMPAGSSYSIAVTYETP